MSYSITLFGHRWYFILKPGEGKARALLQDYSIDQLHSHLLVCYTPDVIPGQTRPFRTKKDKQGHLFGYFDSYVDFFLFIQNLKPQDWSFFEVVFGNIPQKPHFDIDVSTENIERFYPGEDFKSVSLLLREAVILSCQSALQDKGVTLDFERDVLIYSSHGDNKCSYHIILNNKYHANNLEAKGFYDAVMIYVLQRTEGKYARFVDASVYSIKQQFRMIGSQKANSGRPKIFYETFELQGRKYKHIYSEDVSDLNIRKLVILYESLVSFTSGCTVLPSYYVEKENSYDNSNVPEVDEGMVKFCLWLMKEKIEHCPFQVSKIERNQIILVRVAPSLCPICKYVHSNNNPYIFVTGSNGVYWNCRQAAINGFKSLFLGYLPYDLSSIVLQEKETEDNSDSSEDLGEGDVGCIQSGQLMFGDFSMGELIIPEKEKKTDLKQEKDISNEVCSTIPSTPSPLPLIQLKQNVFGELSSLHREKSVKRPKGTIMMSSSSHDWVPGAKR
jgi:hypothetical protein